MKKLTWTAVVLAASVTLPVSLAAAQDITIGVSVSTTG